MSPFRFMNFLIALLMLPLVYMATASVAFVGGWLPAWPNEIRIAILSTVVGVVIGVQLSSSFRSRRPSMAVCKPVSTSR